jgi:[acyl-carrier-protein] S-malonyltransferase
MITAFVCAGQGVEPPWIAPDLLARSGARPLLEAASDATGCDIRVLLARGGTALARTEVLQPALVTACLVAANALAEVGVTPDVVGGHSLGELAAWAAGGHIAPSDAIAAAALRGRLMARQASRYPGGMAAATDHVQRALSIGRTRGRLVIAAYNTPSEITLSGDARAIATVVALGCRRLPVAGAWHSPAMAGAVGELRAALEAIPRTGHGVPFVANRDGGVASAGDIPALLAEQLVRPIEWVRCANTLARFGVTRYIALGPGRLLRAMLRANLGNVDVRIADRASDLRRAVAA